MLMSAELKRCSLVKVQLCQVSSLQDVWHILGKGVGLFASNHLWAAPKKPILNRVNSCKKVMEFFFSKVAGYNLTKKGLHQRFFPVKFVKLFRAVFNQGNFWQMILHLVGLYEILPVFSTEWQYFFDHTMTTSLAEPYQNNDYLVAR